MSQSSLAQALKAAGIVNEDNQVRPDIRRHKPNRRPTRTQKRDKAERDKAESQKPVTP